MNILFLSIDSLSVDIAFRCMQEGANVRFWTKNKDQKEVGNGLVPKVDNWESSVTWAHIIVIDDVGLGNIADDLRKRGKKVFGGSVWGDKLENDREFGMKLAQSVGVKVPEHFKFKKIEQGVKFIRSKPAKYVVKPHGQQERNFCYVAKEMDGSDLVDFLEDSRNTGGSTSIESDGYTIQRVIDGIEVGVSVYSDGNKVARNKNCNFEHKKLLAGNLGPATGETGTVLFNRPSPERIFELTIDKMTPLLLKNNYKGWIDINCIANEEGVWFLEFTSRWGYPQMLIVDELQTMDWSQIIYEVASGNMNDWKTNNDYACGIVCYSEGWPFPDAYQKLGKGRAITGISGNLRHLHFGEMKRENNRYYADGYSGWTAIATGSGSTIHESRKMAISFADKIDFASKGYRNDIGCSSQRDLESLKRMGYLK